MLTKEYKGDVFMKITKKDGVEWKDISNKITKAKENTKKLKKLLDTPGEDKMGKKLSSVTSVDMKVSYVGHI